MWVQSAAAASRKIVDESLESKPSSKGCTARGRSDCLLLSSAGSMECGLSLARLRIEEMVGCGVALHTEVWCPSVRSAMSGIANTPGPVRYPDGVESGIEIAGKVWSIGVNASGLSYSL